MSAHHSFGATYEINKEMKLEGKLVQFVYRNPHSFVHIEAPDDKRREAAVGHRVGRHRAAGESGREARLAQQSAMRSSSPRVPRARPASSAC